MILILGALLGTLLIEVPIAFFLGYRTIKEIISVIAINVLTNPLLNLLIIINSLLLFVNYQLLVLLLEVIVVISEWLLLRYVLAEDYPRKRFLLDSIILNTTSCLIGLIIIKLFFS
ncbi:MAG: hypothetical protein WCP14_00070 [bacterium]